jgi:betaine-aldehyde dehydrogenase
MVRQLKLYINGEWMDASNPEKQDILNPANQQCIAKAPKATKEETITAIESAKSAFKSGVWSDCTPLERARVLEQIADQMEDNLDELVELEMQNNGKTRREAQADATDAAGTFRYYAGLVRNSNSEWYDVNEEIQTMIVKEPMGVAGLIVPWNFPLLMSVWKIAPALAAGNSIILKPAEITPLTAVKMFELLDETDLPKGVAHLVMGSGSLVGQCLAESHDVDVVSFTGSTHVGRSIMKAATGNLKKISLELGGKSPNIIFDDAEIEMAVDYALFGIFLGAGQVCTSGSRILVQKGIYSEFIEKFVSRAKQIKVGPGHDDNTEMGAIVSEKHMHSILEYIQIGKEEGATLACGGNRLMQDGLDAGFFIAPTVFTDVTDDMRIVKEEIFGPVVVIQKFHDEKEVIERANNTDFGLAGAVFSRDHQKAMRVIKKVRSGITWVNTYHLTDVHAPWGGYKHSGIGRSLGKNGLEEYQEVKQINVNMDSKPIGWFGLD